MTSKGIRSAADGRNIWMAMVECTSRTANGVENGFDDFIFPEEIPVPEPIVTAPEQVFSTPTDERRMRNSPSIEIYDSGCTRHMTSD
jgi:hypothetical protein